MLTRSKTRKLRNFNKIKSSEITMASNGDINGSDEVEFDINNQMGETERFEEVTENEVVLAPLEARGRTEENTTSTIQHTNVNIDMATILQLLAENNKQLITENTKVAQQITEQLTQQIAEHISQVTQKLEENHKQTKQLTESTRKLEKRIDEVKESIQENNIQIRKEVEQYVTRQVNEHRERVDQQIEEIKRENQEISTKLRSEAKEVVNEESEVADKDCDGNDKPLERAVK